jgi:hypothetical protein
MRNNKARPVSLAVKPEKQIKEKSMSNTKRIPAAAIALIFAIMACNLPSPQQLGGAATALAQTAAAQLTQAAYSPTAIFASPAPATSAPPTAVPPTLPPPPTAAPTTTCEQGQFITDVTVPDGSLYDAGDTFTKTWRIKNIGTCTWTGFSMVFDSGDLMGGASPTAIGTVAPGASVDLSVALTAPAANGSYRGYWRIRNGSGVLIPVVGGYLNKSFYVDISVGGGGGGGPFAVIHVTYTVSSFNQPGFVGCPKVTAHITTNGAGDVQYHWRRSDNSESPVATLHFASATTQDVERTWTLGSVWLGTTNWLGIYIDEPNHQNFGHANVTPCTSP